jgi:regulator of protease activity HflC (stomatin/prohibitin superfamily)
MPAAIIILIFVIIIIIATSVRVINQYERGVVFQLGKVESKVREPGLRFIIPIIDQMRKVSLRIVTLPIESQKINLLFTVK